jgi:hypothetical protein
MTITPPDPTDPEDSQESEKNNQAWDAIVADLSGQIDLGPHFRSEPTPQELTPERDYIDEYFDEGYVPPEPPQLTAPSDAIARFAWAGVLGGPVILLLSFVLGLGGVISTTGLVATIGGFVFLMSKRDKHVPPGEDYGDGAVV